LTTYFAGRISPEALAAIAKSWPIYFIAIAVAVGIGAGTTALISNAIGAKEDRKASMYVAQSIVLAISNFNFCNCLWIKFFR
jgi:Na+-driven multidrug efflux pump